MKAGHVETSKSELMHISEDTYLEGVTSNLDIKLPWNPGQPNPCEGDLCFAWAQLWSLFTW